MLLLRHASAGDRLASPARDRGRGLDERGRRDALALPDALSGYTIERIVSSPHARCVDTVSPLARRRGLELEAREELVPDGSLEGLLLMLDELPDSTLVCTHREAIDRLFDGDLRCEKGGTWVLAEREDGRVPLAYLPPPSALA